MPLDLNAESAPAQFNPQMQENNGRNPVVDKVWKDFEDAKSYKRLFDKDWPRFYLLYAGRHWDGRQESWQSTPVINLTWSVIRTIVPILTDSRPQVSVIPRQPEYDHIGGVLADLVDWVWDKNDMDIKLPKIMTNCMIFGNCFVKAFWNQTLLNGMGDIELKTVDASHIFTSPHATTLEDSSYIIHAENITQDMAERVYPEYVIDGKRRPDGPQDVTLTLDRTVTSQNNGGAGNIAANNVRATDGSSVQRTWAEPVSASTKTDGLVTVLEKWERDRAGQIVQTVVINDQLIFERPSPFKHGRFPFAHFVDVPHTWSMWAMGEVQQVEKLQIEIDRRRGHIQDILRYTATPILVVDPDSVDDFDSVRPRPGLVLPVSGGLQSAGWLTPPSMPNALFESSQLDKQDFDLVLGNVDVMSGRKPAGIDTGVAIELLQEAANVRMREKARHLENSIRKLGELIVGLIQEFYDTERVFRIAGGQAGRLEAPITEEMRTLVINQPQSAEIGPDGQPIVTRANEIPPLETAEFDVKVGSGTTLPVSRSAMFQRLVALFQLGIVDDAEVLKGSGLPRWDEIYERVQIKKQQMMAQQMAMQQEQMDNEAAAGVSDDQFEQEMASGAAVEPETQL